MKTGGVALLIAAGSTRASAPVGGTAAQPVDRLLDDGFAGREDRREEVHFVVRSR
jgi:hypothetical protein